MKLLSHSYGTATFSFLARSPISILALSIPPGTRRVNANEVYQEYIKDKNHYHMNATRVSAVINPFNIP